MKTSYVVGILVVLVIIGGVVWYSRAGSASEYQVSGQTAPEGTQTETPSSAQPAASAPQGTDVSAAASASGAGASTGGSATVSGTAPSAAMSATVNYTSSGFSPASVTIAKGGTVTFVDKTGEGFWVASGVHPVHSVYDGTTLSAHCAASYAGPKPFDQCSTGSSYSFTFTKTGTWFYHNHVDAGDTGKIIVE